MSRAKGLLKRFMHELTKEELCSVPDELQAEIEELLAQPEQEPTTRHALDSYWNQEAYQRGYARAELDLKRERLGDGITADMYRANKKATHPDSYWAGVYDAEKAHGIGVDDDK